MDVVHVAADQRLVVERSHRDRHVLQLLLAPLRGHDHLLQLLRHCLAADQHGSHAPERLAADTTPYRKRDIHVGISPWQNPAPFVPAGADVPSASCPHLTSARRGSASRSSPPIAAILRFSLTGFVCSRISASTREPSPCSRADTM